MLGYKLGRQNIIHPALFSTILGIFLSNGTLADVEYTLGLYRKFNAAGYEDGKTAILQNLGRVKEPDLLGYVLQQIFTEDIRNQDVRTILSFPEESFRLTIMRYASFYSLFNIVRRALLVFGSGFRRTGKLLRKP